MTTPTQAAQPVLTDDEILTVTLYGQSEARMIRNGRAIESALLSKLRAPVADERAAFETWNSMHGQYRRSDAYERLDTGDYVKWPVEHGWRVWQARAALANASVADSTLPLEQALYELVDKIDAGLDTGDILQDARRASTALDAIMASAPVALSGVERQAVTGLIAVARAAFTFCDDAEDTGVATVNVDRDDIAKLGEALDLLDELPDDQPGYSMGPSNRAEWALRRLLGVASAPVAGEAQPVIHQHGFAADNQRLRAINESLDKQLEEVMAVRDEYHDMADKLANAIADHLLVEIGEHSSSNCPWMRALDAIENAAPQASPVAGTVQSTDRQEALRIAGLPNVDAALSNFANDCTQDNAVGLVQAILDAAPQASAEAELRAAYNEWQDKTDFIQEWVQSGKLPVKYLGWHRADVMRDLIEQATPAPTAVEGVDDVALPPIPHEWAPIIPSAFAGALLEWAKAYARAALSAQPGAIRNPLIAELSGNSGELDCAALSARKEPSK